MSLQPFLANRATAAGNPGSVSQAAASGEFQRIFGDSARIASAGPVQARLEAPKVDLIEENGRVASIVVTCRCCERIELTCSY